MENKISDENAQKQIDKFCEFYDVFLEDMDGDQAKALKGSLKKLHRAIMQGRVEIMDAENENGASVVHIIQHLKNPIRDMDKITYPELKGIHKTAMREEENGSNYTKIYQLLGACSKLGHVFFTKLVGPDSSLAETIGTIFLAG